MPDRYEFFTRDGSTMRHQLSTVASSPFEHEPIPDCSPIGGADGDLDFDRQCRCCRFDDPGTASVADGDDDDHGGDQEDYRDNGNDFCSVFPVRAEITRPVLEEIILMVTRHYGMDRRRLRGDAIGLKVEAIIRERMQDAVRRHANCADFVYEHGAFVPNQWNGIRLASLSRWSMRASPNVRS